MVPGGPTNNFIDTSLGLAWHSDGAMLRGILEKASAGTRAATNGAVIAARSENDTQNNPHNPMYGIWRAGADGSLLSLIGSRSSDSGGNSMAPPALIDLSRGKEVGFLQEIVFALGEIGGSEAEAYLFTVAQGHDQPAIQAAAQQALDTLYASRKHGSPEARGADPADH